MKIYYLAITSFNRWTIANTSREAENLEQDKRVKLLYAVYHWEDVSVIHYYHKLCTQTALFKQILELFKKNLVLFVGETSNIWTHLIWEWMYLCPPYFLTGSCRKYCPEGPHLFQSQRYWEGGAVAGQERCWPANEVHLQRLWEPLRQQQRRAAAVAWEGAFIGHALAWVVRGSRFLEPRHAHGAW